MTKSAIVATGSFPMRPPIEGLDSSLCVDSTGLLAQEQVPKRLVVLKGYGHYEVYAEPAFGEVMAATLDWLGQHLPARA